MKSNLKRTFLWLALSIFTFFVFTLGVNAQEDKTKKVNKKEVKKELKKINRVFKLSPGYETTSKEVKEPKKTEIDGDLKIFLSKNQDFDLETTKIDRLIEKEEISDSDSIVGTKTTSKEVK